MPTSTLYAPLTAGAFLFGDSPGAHTAEAVAHAISQQGAARSALRSVHAAVGLVGGDRRPRDRLRDR